MVLAAGEGKRMRSGRPKILHLLGGQPLIRYPVGLVRQFGISGAVVVVAPAAAAVRAALADLQVSFVEQPEPRGTGDALRRARSAVPEAATELLLLYGDVPLLRGETLDALLARHRVRRAVATLLTFVPADPTGYGRVRRGRDGRVRAIVEERDATPVERRVRECNSGIYCFDPRRLWPALEAVARRAPDNAQGEVYLTDVIGHLAQRGGRIEAVRVTDPLEVAGVNDRRQLAALEELLRSRTLAGLMAAGVTVVDPAVTYVDTTVTIGRDTVLQPGVRLAGRTAIGAECVIGTGSQLTDTVLGDRVTLRPYCVLDGSRVEADATLGPFARLRRGTVVGPEAEIGNFIELKQATIGRRVKAHHVGYIGDATVGEGANIGAGVITCNYDGERKHETRIGARAFVGTNASLVAPLAIGDDAYVGAGSVVTRDVPPGALAIERATQVVKEGWRERRRGRPKAETPPEGSAS
ncbi:MAG TPA: bifunctional UDP-N-acetylglucosamine diphosphorylase/glucosamine-1-phosphate N-acetyltransferase GlmU [Methylomirabilota bacterium]